jgi:hypothetical protein
VWWIRPFPKGDTVRARMASPSKTRSSNAAAPTADKMDTIVFLLLRDSVVLLKPTHQTLPPAAAKHFRNIMVEAKADKKLQEKLNPGKPPR